MAQFTIEAGLRFYRENLPFVVISRENDDVVIENTLNRDRQIEPLKDLEVRFLDGSQVAIFEKPISDDIPVPVSDMLNEAEASMFARRCAYINKLDELSGGLHIKKYIALAITQVSAELKDPRPPGESTLYRWAGKWRHAGENLAALVPKRRKRGPQSMYLRKDAQRLLMDVLEKKYLVLERPTLKSVFPDIEEAFTLYNRNRDIGDQCEIPSRSTIYRFVDQLCAYEVMVKRYGKNAADRYFKHVGKGLVADAPLDIVRIDHTPIDLQVLIPTNNIVARPTLTVATDVFSRMPLGIYIGFASPGYEALMQCLRSAILPKDKLLKRFPEINGTWPCHGVPRMVCFDNGMEFHSKHLKDALSMLGVSMMFSPAKSPWYNGIAERFFGTINQGLLSSLKGKTFSNIREKGDYDPVKNAVMPYAVFETILYKWIVDVFIRDFHTGIDDFPLEAWEKGVSQYPVSLPSSPENLLILLSEVEYRTLTRKGVQLDSVQYNSEELNAYFRKLGKKTKVKLKVDPMDIGWVYVFDESDQSFIKVPSLHEEYQGLSKWQHKVVRQLVNARRKQGEQKYNVSEALREIARYIEQHSSKGKKKSHKRIARFTSYSDPANQQKGKAIKQPNSEAKPFDVELEEMDVSELLEAAKSAGWLDLNNDDDMEV